MKRTDRYNGIHFKYLKFKHRLERAISNGTFARYTFDKRAMLLKRLDRYRRQFENLCVPWKKATIGVVAASSLTLSSVSTQAQELIADSEFPVNTYTTAAQSKSDLAMDDNGNFVVVWYSFQQDGDSRGIFAQRFDNTGTAIDDEFQVNTYTTGIQDQPAVAIDADGDFIVTWQSNLQDGSEGGVFAQLYDKNGVKVDDEFQVHTTTAETQRSPSVAMDGDGDFIITWESDVQDGDGDGIFAQRFNSDGSKEGDEFQVNSTSTGDQFSSDVAMDENGNFIVVWTNLSNSLVYGIKMQEYDNSGEKKGGEYWVNSSFRGIRDSPSVALNPDGDYTIAWESAYNYSDILGIFALHFRLDGSASGSDFQVNTHTTGNQTDPSVAIDDEGNFMIAWESENQDGDGIGIFAQRYGSDESILESEFQINDYTTSNQNSPSISTNPEGTFAISWESNGQDTSFDGIFARRYGTAPILSSIGNQNAYSDALLEFTATTDKQSASFSLDDTSKGLGMLVNEETGVFSWTPIGSQVGAHIVTLTASSNGFEDSEIFTITVEDNVSPVLESIEDQIISELETLNFTAVATDSNSSQDLIYSLDATSKDSGMTINSMSGDFSWTPTESQDGVHTVIIKVSDGIAEDSEELIISVSEVNASPVLEAIGGQSVEELATLSINVSAIDSDVPIQALTYQIDAPSLASGMTLDSKTGAFSWTPTESQLGPHTVTIEVTDGVLADNETFTITVNPILDLDDRAILDISIYPNPTHTTIYIKSIHNLEGFKIMNLMGQRILEGHFEGKSLNNILVKSLPKGTYLLELYNDEYIQVKRFIKNN